MAELGAQLSEVMLQTVCRKRWAPSSGTPDGWRTEPCSGGPVHPPACVQDAPKLGTFAGAQVEQDESRSEFFFFFLRQKLIKQHACPLLITITCLERKMR